MMNTGASAGSFIQDYILFAIAMCIIFGLLGWFSPDLTKPSSSRLPKFLLSPNEQRNWRAAKAAAILFAGLGLFISVFNVEKLADDIWRPSISRNLQHDVSELTSNLSLLYEGLCSQGQRTAAICEKKGSVDAAIREALTGRPINKTFVLRYAQGDNTPEMNRRIATEIDQINTYNRILDEKPAVDPHAKLWWASRIAVLLAIALGISFGESVFQVRAERDNLRRKAAEDAVVKEVADKEAEATGLTS